MRDFVCAVFCLAGYPSLKVGHTVYRMIPAVITRVRPNVPLTLGDSADLSSFVRCPYPYPDRVRVTSVGPGPALPSMYAPILLLILVSIMFACKEPQPKS